MDEVEIPVEWRRRVCDILRTRDGRRILVVNRARHEWEAAFPASFSFELYKALLDALEVDGVTGKRVIGMEPPPARSGRFGLSMRGKGFMAR